MAAACILLAGTANAQTFNWYGFIRNYGVYDSHASSAGTESLYYYMPTDTDENVASMNFVALTSRLGVDVKGYEVEGYKVAAKIETDFYNENGTTAILRLRQAYFTMAKDQRTWKIGQAWHPMAADLPDIFSLESGAPFGPFSRTPLVQLDYKLGDNVTANAAAIWQMQYTSTGPAGANASYIKSACMPELFVGLTYKNDKSTVKVGADVLNIKPYGKKTLTTTNYFAFLQHTAGDLTIKSKLTYANDGSHFNMIGGYGVCDGTDAASYTFSATRTAAGWLTATYKGMGKLVPSVLLGATRNLGTEKDIVSGSLFFKKLNADKLHTLYRIQPEVVYNLGKIQFGLEYMFTSAEYAKKVDAKMCPASDGAELHWVDNNRIQMMLKYTF